MPVGVFELGGGDSTDVRAVGLLRRGALVGGEDEKEGLLQLAGCSGRELLGLG